MEIKGLDISSYQNGISFDAIKNSVNFLILRAGFTGWGTGVSYNKDNCFENFYNQAKSRGIPVGAYWYSCANTYQKGVNEANYMYDNCLKGKQFEYPIYIDVEDTHHQVGNKNGVTQAIKGFCETLEAKGYYVGIYASDISGFKDKMNISQLGDYDKWVARYGSKPSYAVNYGMWQSSSSGKINGYSGNLDTDVAYKDYPSIIKSSGLNGYGTFTNKPVESENTAVGGKFKIGDKVIVSGALYVSSNASNATGRVNNKVTNITRYVAGAKHPYNTTGDLGWMDESSIRIYSTGTGTSSTLNVGDKVKIVGNGNGSSDGSSGVAGGIGWERKILKIHNGKKYPYQVGDSTGTTGFYQASALQKI